MKLRRSAPVALSLAAAGLVLAACGSGEATGDSDVLNVWFPGNLSQEIAWVNDELVPAFEAEHDVEVEVEFVDWADVSARLSTAFAGGTAPDVFGHGNAAAAGYAANDRVVVLDDYLADLPPEEVADLTFLDDGKVDGEQVIMPLRGFGFLLAYRADAFADAGLDPDDPPQTWADLRSTAETLTERDGDTITRSGVIMPADNPTSMSQAFTSFLFQAGGSLVDGDGTTATWNSPEGVEALEFLADLYNGDGAVAMGLGEATSGAGAQHPLATGRAAMALIDEATLKSIHEQAPEVAEQIRVAPPLRAAAAAAFGGAGNGLFISADSELQDQAWDFIEFLLRPENAKAYVQAVGGIPARSSLATDPELADTPYIGPFMEAVESFHGNPNLEAWTQVRDVLAAGVESALRGATPAEQALDDTAAEADALLAAD
ncbi:ABC transporter substrate-binding protein [Jiangella asiatica]|uniref:ABC transporter substrate-binding protein n=1 Tax=Jiangella asiatica TaxID=2530372 RepID=A0A4R5DJH4_9ACTN|nr:ABC transporter substrate-binding protein [Jiangella asiatica]TDE14266.1 ABC transporter substrate-binding protein [Jiangella asiatica]